MATMGTRSINTRAVKRLDKPKPLKAALRNSAPDVPARLASLEDTIQSLEKVVNAVLTKSYSELVLTVPSLVPKLKTAGAQLEESYHDDLNRAFVMLRNACRDSRMDILARFHLLYLIELRAGNWQVNPAQSLYYSPVPPQTPQATPEGLDDGSSMYNSSGPPLLLPGEVLKPSGKFAAPTRLPGKNYCKDEVVIRNADSGKVMGIRGRRVHMIEELSETVISFQRVSPGAKERLVQITGPNEDKIDLAKQLMEETIKRNASPVREREESGSSSAPPPGGGSNSSLNSSTSDEQPPVGRVNLRKSVHETGLFEYKHTVNVGESTLHLSSVNLNLVREAKILLDQAFGSEKLDSKLGDTTNTPQISKMVGESKMRAQESVDSDDTPTIIETEEDPKKASGDGASALTEEIPINRNSAPQYYLREKPKWEYSREFLLNCSGSYASRLPPKQWERIGRDYPGIVKQSGGHLDAAAYEKKWADTLVRLTSTLTLPSDYDYPESD